MRTQLALAYHAPGYLPPHHYDQIFSAHGVIMIFFMSMVFMVGLMNLVVPLQIGARDVAFPFLNSLSFWMTAISVALINISLVVGEFAKTGWLAYPPLSELQFSPGVGVDYYIWSLQLSGVGTLQPVAGSIYARRFRCGFAALRELRNSAEQTGNELRVLTPPQ